MGSEHPLIPSAECPSFGSAWQALRALRPCRRSAHVLYDDSDDGGGGLGGAPRPLPVNVAPRAGRGAKAEVEAEADGAAGTPRQMEASLKDDSDDSAALLGAGLDLPLLTGTICPPPGPLRIALRAATPSARAFAK